MAGKLRKGTGLSDAAQGCCTKCCATVCHMSKWNKLICYAMIALVIASLVLIIGGAFAADGTGNSARLICASTSVSSASNSTPSQPNSEDLFVPLIRQNANVWWLANAGIFCMIMVAASLVCCCSYVILCCGLTLPTIVRVGSIIGLVILAIAFSMFVVWLGFGSYLISLFGPEAALQKVCRGIVVYVIFMYIYFFVFLVVCAVGCVYSVHGTAEDLSKKSRDSVKSQPKMPSTTMLKAMV